MNSWVQVELYILYSVVTFYPRAYDSVWTQLTCIGIIHGMRDETNLISIRYKSNLFYI